MKQREFSSRTAELSDSRVAVAFYEDRYVHGYMDDWPAEKKQRVFELLRQLELPETGDALDFGCGNGVFTGVLRQALPPGWKIWGVDISETAIANARTRHPGCSFFTARDPALQGRRFDFVFSHHVLEHVHDLAEVLAEVEGWCAERAFMMHILPCGNPGSFEHGVCLLRKDGMNPRLGNRFFFEDEGHVRRLTTDQLSRALAEKGFALSFEAYGNQYCGAIAWITGLDFGFVRSFTDPGAAVNDDARHQLAKVRRKLVLLSALRYPTRLVERKWQQPRRSLRDWLVLGLAVGPYVISKPLDAWLRIRAREEWDRRRSERNGSEMYLFFQRSGRNVSPV